MIGRTVLAKSILSSMPTHVMQYISIPSKVLHTVDKIQRDFIRGSEAGRNPLLNWDTLTKSKHQEGLGLQKTDLKNRALHASLAWRLATNPSSLWGRILTTKYQRASRNTSTNRVVSRTWKIIQQGRRECFKGMTWHANKGNRANSIRINGFPTCRPLGTSFIHGPLPENGDNVIVDSSLFPTGWNLSSIPFELSQHLIHCIKDALAHANANKEDTMY